MSSETRVSAEGDRSMCRGVAPVTVWHVLGVQESQGTARGDGGSQERGSRGGRRARILEVSVAQELLDRCRLHGAQGSDRDLVEAGLLLLAEECAPPGSEPNWVARLRNP